MTTQTLKPCPFCGGEAAAYSALDRNNFRMKHVGCLDCYTRTFVFSSFEEAIKAWNTRHTPPEGAKDE